MACTTIDQLTTPSPTTGEIDNGDGFYEPMHTFFYAEDIKRVISQAPATPVSNLRLVNVRFERQDGSENHDIEHITVLALRKTDAEIAAMNGNFDNEDPGKSKYNNIVALAWPPYYRAATTELTDDRGGTYEDQTFDGSEDYFPGALLDRDPE